MNPLLEEALQRRVDVTPITNLSNQNAIKQMQREYWEAEMAKYLAEGGKVTELKCGQVGVVFNTANYISEGRTQTTKRSTRNSTKVYRSHDADTYEGIPCRKCGLVLRYVSNGICVYCARQRRKKSA